MHLQRNGDRIVDADAGGAPIVFSGGFFRPFTTVEEGQTVPTPERRLLHPGGGVISITPANSTCTEPAAKASACFCGPVAEAKFDRWTWTAALNSLEARGINLVRVFSMGGHEYRKSNADPVDVYPFLRDASGKHLVQAAVEQGRWNNDYFLRYLRPFVDAAAAKNIAVQLCLFTFHDFYRTDTPYFKYFPAAPWNPGATAPSAWGETNLIPSTITDPYQRNFYFMNTANAIIKTQDWFIGCVIETLAGAKNVILELFNEPRSLRRNREGVIVEDNREKLVGWYLRMIRYTREMANRHGWRPLISVNASDFHKEEQRWDIDLVRDRSPEIFSMVDMISYHGLTGYPEVEVDDSPCAEIRFAPVAPKHIDDRVKAHFNRTTPRPNGAFPDQPLIFSTDAVKRPTHKFIEKNTLRPGNELELDKRDGQVATDLPYEATGTPELLVHRSDLSNWAYWSLKAGYANPGRVHFQNHSIFEPSFSRIAEARTELRAEGDLLRPAYTTAGWTQYSHLSDPHAGRNFWWAQRFLAAEGGSVTQLGTESAPADPRWELQVETGWRMTFAAPATRWCCFNVSVLPVSVSDREQGATVVPLAVARLHEVVNGVLRPALATQEMLLRPGATAAMLSVSGDLIGGRQYALVFAGAVKVSYHNRYQGYGEVIVHFPSVRKIG